LRNGEELNTSDHGENLRKESEYGCTPRQFWHAGPFKCYVFRKELVAKQSK